MAKILPTCVTTGIARQQGKDLKGRKRRQQDDFSDLFCDGMMMTGAGRQLCS